MSGIYWTPDQTRIGLGDKRSAQELVLLCLGLPTLHLGIAGLPHLPSPSILHLPSLLPLSPGALPVNQLWGPGERSKLPQWGLGQSPSQQTIWCMLNVDNIVEVPVAIVCFKSVHRMEQTSYML